MLDLITLTKSQIIDLIAEKLIDRAGESHAEAMRVFVDQFFCVSAPDELRQSDLEYLCDSAYSYWQVQFDFDATKPDIRVFNPDFAEHGWHSKHTIVQVHMADMPFLVDSIRMELNRRNIGIFSINNCVLAVERQGTQLVNLSRAKDKTKNQSLESIIHIEVDRQTKGEPLVDLADSLKDILAEVEDSVGDFKAMLSKVETAKADLAGARKQFDDVDEHNALIDWLVDDHFIFLGYEFLTNEGDNDKPALKCVPESRLGLQKRYYETPDSLQAEQDAGLLDEVCVCRFGKDRFKSRVHRPAYRDLIALKAFDKKGNFIGKHRFYGLYTSPVFVTPPRKIPVIREKIKQILDDCEFEVGGHSYKALAQILTDIPREELILASVEKLEATSLGIFNMQERRQAGLFVRKDSSKRYYSCLYYIPTDLYTTELRNRVEHILKQGFGAHDVEATAQISQTLLSRTHFVLYVDPSNQGEVDPAPVEARVLEISRSWEDELQSSLAEALGEEQGSVAYQNYRGGFSAAYQEAFSPGNAVTDIQHCEQVDHESGLLMRFYINPDNQSQTLRFKLYNPVGALVLSDAIPVLENFGLRVLSEHPFVVHTRSGETCWISDFEVTHNHGDALNLAQFKKPIEDAFTQIWAGRAVSDKFNRLILSAQLHWRDAAMLRAISRYIKQLKFGYSQPFMADVLERNGDITKALVALFKCRFDPAGDQSETRADELRAQISEALDQVASLDDDKILRRFVDVISAVSRTNFYQVDEDGEYKDYFSFKVHTQSLADIPKPKPKFEIYVYAPWMEGVHLRAGSVARGGLRWSDRVEDYRTEVLGLVKAQQVKNSVIVPTGAKGCFICKQMPSNASREEMQAEGIRCYKTFIRGLLDITDNRRGDEIIPPQNVVRHDGDDPYLVVAADKGTATFSDIANGLAEEYGFWLGDAFASGGSQGYDHKGMGITAKGAWESVKRHFREFGVNTQTDEFTVVGIGDMSGDVFGNGMLLSETIQLVAAFNHLHIFVDPNPDAAKSFKERERMFALPRSTWADYDTKLMSKGGGIFSRSAKSIDISPEIAKRFDITEKRLSPNELLGYILRARVDMVWNGGIGTYVKSTAESHADVGDKANDAIRINGNQLRCKVLGEGGNLGFTQLGRVEFAKTGGAANTDFIDNAGGVDCSDHEVNIKILLNSVVEQGDLTVKQRNQILEDMTDEVSDLVLTNNYRQAQALSIAKVHAQESLDDYIRLMNSLEKQGKLDPALEYLPTEGDLRSRVKDGGQLTRPELSVLISYAKIDIKQALVDSWLTEDKTIQYEMTGAFPASLVEKYPAGVFEHRMRKEIVANQIANDIANRMGITFAFNLKSVTGLGYTEIAAAYLCARTIFDVKAQWRAIEGLDNQVPNAVQVEMMRDVIRLLTRTTYWLLRNHGDALASETLMSGYQEEINGLIHNAEALGEVVPDSRWRTKFDRYVEAGVPNDLAAYCAASESLYWMLDIVDIAGEQGAAIDVVANCYFGLGSQLDLIWLDDQLREYAPASHWQARAAVGYRVELDGEQHRLCKGILAASGSSAIEKLDAWMADREGPIERWQSNLVDIKASSLDDSAIFAVALSALSELR
ncbi:MAG: NAD-glutamate dehydrogenase [Pontibacterium sp.]